MEYVIGKDQGGKLKKYKHLSQEISCYLGFYVEIKRNTRVRL